MPQIPLSGAIAENVSGLSLIQKDLANAGRWIAKAEALAESLRSDESQTYYQIKDRDLGDEIKSLFVSSLIFYAKAYTQAAGRRAQMSRDWLDEGFRDAHDYFMSLRHNMVAHSGDDKVELAESYILLLPAGDGFNFRLATSRMQPDIAMRQEDTGRFRNVIAHAIEKVEQKYNKASRKLIEDAVVLGVGYWTEAYRSGEPVDTKEIRRKNLRVT